MIRRAVLVLVLIGAAFAEERRSTGLAWPGFPGTLPEAARSLIDNGGFDRPLGGQRPLPGNSTPSPPPLLSLAPNQAAPRRKHDLADAQADPRASRIPQSPHRRWLAPPTSPETDPQLPRLPQSVHSR